MARQPSLAAISKRSPLQCGVASHHGPVSRCSEKPLLPPGTWASDDTWHLHHPATPPASKIERCFCISDCQIETCHWQPPAAHPKLQDRPSSAANGGDAACHVHARCRDLRRTDRTHGNHIRTYVLRYRAEGVITEKHQQRVLRMQDAKFSPAQDVMPAGQEKPDPPAVPISTDDLFSFFPPRQTHLVVLGSRTSRPGLRRLKRQDRGTYIFTLLHICTGGTGGAAMLSISDWPQSACAIDCISSLGRGDEPRPL